VAPGQVGGTGRRSGSASRNAAFLLTLRDGGRFAAVDLPEANGLTAGITALLAEQERRRPMPPACA
jgi:hypothetical protein